MTQPNTTDRSHLLRKIILHEEIDEEHLERLKAHHMEFNFITIVHSGRKYPEYFACECFFVHEYFEYISSNGDINMDEFERVCSWIDSQQCPHVEKASLEGQHKLVKTSITAQHAVVAGNNTKLYSIFGKQLTITGMCAIGAEVIAVLKQRHSFIEYAIENGIDVGTDRCIVFQRCNCSDEGSIAMYFTDVLRLAIRMDDHKMFQLLLKADYMYMTIYTALLYSLHLNRDQITQTLLSYSLEKNILAAAPPPFQHFDECRELIRQATLDATLLDHPGMLKLMSRFGLVSSVQTRCMLEITPQLKIAYQISRSLGHSSCTEILGTFIDDPPKEAYQQNAFALALGLLQLRSDPAHCVRVIRKLYDSGFDVNCGDITVISDLVKQQIMHSQLSHPVLNCNMRDRRSGRSSIHSIRCESSRNGTGACNCVHRAILQYDSGLVYRCTDTLSTLLELGCDINITHFINSSHEFHREIAKSIIKVFLINNAVDMSKCVPEALKLDRKHRLNDTVRNSCLQLMIELPPLDISHFVTSLLWDCGIQIPQDIGKDFSIPGMLKEHFAKAMRQTYSLKMCCRTVLRRRFPRRQIHKYLELMKCPTTIRDYILLRHLVNGSCKTLSLYQ